jgi:hypothetical protein
VVPSGTGDDLDLQQNTKVLATLAYDPSPVEVQVTFHVAENPRRHIAVLDDLDRLSLLPDALLRDIVSRLPIKDVVRTAVLSRRWRPLYAAPSVSFVRCSLIFTSCGDSRDVLRLDPNPCDALRPGCFHEVRVISGTVPVAMRERLPGPARGHHAHGNCTILVSFDLDPRDVDPERAYTISAFESFHIGRVKCVLHAVPLGAYDNSLDDGPKLGVAEVALAAAAALRTDAVGAVGGGPLAGVAVMDQRNYTKLSKKIFHRGG